MGACLDILFTVHAAAGPPFYDFNELGSFRISILSAIRKGVTYFNFLFGSWAFAVPFLVFVLSLGGFKNSLFMARDTNADFIPVKHESSRGQLFQLDLLIDKILPQISSPFNLLAFGGLAGQMFNQQF